LPSFKQLFYTSSLLILSCIWKFFPLFSHLFYFPGLMRMKAETGCVISDGFPIWCSTGNGSYDFPKPWFSCRNTGLSGLRSICFFSVFNTQCKTGFGSLGNNCAGPHVPSLQQNAHLFNGKSFISKGWVGQHLKMNSIWLNLDCRGGEGPSKDTLWFVALFVWVFLYDFELN
jgi:hypothetical protein